jgi:nitrogenase subunit NifH
MAALSTSAEYQAVREAIQLLTTLGTDGKRRDVVSFSVDGQTVTYGAAQLPVLIERERELANRICNRNRRKRTSPDFSY